jgi:thiosulfate/3-mercaptopyruvate sulfurtransferase
LGFKIGRNPLPDKRSYEYVVLRHVPVDPNTFVDWGLALGNYSALPTWKYASPHNIRRTTPQTDTTGTGSCSAVCHNSGTLFLRAADLRDYEVEANAGVLVPDGPAPWEE